jgi:hypothetical protein
MVPRQQPSTAQPAASLKSLTSQIAAAQAGLNAARARRSEILAQIDAAQGQRERVQLRNGPLYGASDQVDRLTVQLTDLQADLRLREAIAANPTTAQSGPTPASLRAQIKATQVSLNDALARRAGILAQIDAAQGPAERAQLRNSALPGVDQQIGRFQGTLTGLQAELYQREAAPQTPSVQPAPLPVQPVVPTPAPTAGTLVPPTSAPPMTFTPDVLWMGAAVVALAPIAIAIAWRIARGGTSAVKKAEWLASEERMQRVEDVVEAIATDVGRVSEGHRFLTNVLAEAPATISPPERDREPVQPQAEPGSRSSFLEARLGTKATASEENVALKPKPPAR